MKIGRLQLDQPYIRGLTITKVTNHLRVMGWSSKYIPWNYNYPPPRLPVTTRIVTLLAGNPYKLPLFVTVTGWEVNPNYKILAKISRKVWLKQLESLKPTPTLIFQFPIYLEPSSHFPIYPGNDRPLVPNIWGTGRWGNDKNWLAIIASHISTTPHVSKGFFRKKHPWGHTGFPVATSKKLDTCILHSMNSWLIKWQDFLSGNQATRWHLPVESGGNSSFHGPSAWMQNSWLYPIATGVICRVYWRYVY